MGSRVESLRFVLRDRDSKYTGSFEAEKMKVLLNAPQAPRMNAYCERVIGTVRREVLDHILIMNEARAERVLAEYAGWPTTMARNWKPRSRWPCIPETGTSPPVSTSTRSLSAP